MCSSDSPGHQISKTNPVLIIDLDETLLSVNSFPLWAKCFLFNKFKNLSFHQHCLLRLRAIKIFIERKALKRNHAHTKSSLQKLWVQSIGNNGLDNILYKLEQKIRPNMRDVIELIAKNEIDGILATAAATLYAEPFAKLIGFSHILSTGINSKENSGEEKCHNVLEYLTIKGWESRKRIFFTDHVEDIPLASKSDKLMWFGEPEELRILQKYAPNLDIVVCKNLTSKEIIREL